MLTRVRSTGFALRILNRKQLGLNQSQLVCRSFSTVNDSNKGDKVPEPPTTTPNAPAASKPSFFASMAQNAQQGQQGSSQQGQQGSSQEGQQHQSKFSKVAKYGRTAIMVLLGGYYFSKIFLDPDNPDSAINRALNPRGRAKYVIKFERVDDRIAGYQKSFMIASGTGVKSALAAQTKADLIHKFGRDIEMLTPEQIATLMKSAKEHREAMKSIDKAFTEVRENYVNIVRKNLKDKVVTTEQDKKKTEANQITPPAATTATDAKSDGKEVKLITVDISQLTTQEKELKAHLMKGIEMKLDCEMQFMKLIETVLISNPAVKIDLAKKPSMINNLKNKLLGLNVYEHEVFMEALVKTSLLPNIQKPRVFLLSFNGNTAATQVQRLREEITAVINIADANRGDKIILQLNSPGGTVTGYGLAAAQLQRIKDAKLPLIVSVDEVAASGGYMMACVADEIVASPFAIVGSVGVVATIPNFADRLNREGVNVEDVTAGKFKRTLTPYKKPTDSDRAKVKADVEQILVHFKSFIQGNRPKLDVDLIATGETWMGADALRLKLVDRCATTDDLIIDEVHRGAEVYAVSLRAVTPRFTDSLEDEQHTSMTMMMKHWIMKNMTEYFMKQILGNVNGGGDDSLYRSYSQYGQQLDGGYDFQMNNQEYQSYQQYRGDIPIHHQVMAISDDPRRMM